MLAYYTSKTTLMGISLSPNKKSICIECLSVHFTFDTEVLIYECRYCPSAYLNKLFDVVNTSIVCNRFDISEILVRKPRRSVKVGFQMVPKIKW